MLQVPQASSTLPSAVCTAPRYPRVTAWVGLHWAGDLQMPANLDGGRRGYELRDRRTLLDQELGQMRPDDPVRAVVQQKLQAVIEEQDERTRARRAPA
jgi:hypothetical protein